MFIHYGSNMKCNCSSLFATFIRTTKNFADNQNLAYTCPMDHLKIFLEIRPVPIPEQKQICVPWHKLSFAGRN